jgi:hypothetical protein
MQVLQIFEDRFAPRIWSGSRAAILEANAAALDSLPAQFSDDLMRYVGQLKTQLLERAARWRRDETERDWDRDERFE